MRLKELHDRGDPPLCPTLEGLALSSAERLVTRSSGHVEIRALRVSFSPATSPGMESTLKRTYTIKPLVLAVTGESVFGEIAVLRALEADGWEGVWVDTFHRKFWNGMPGQGACELLNDARRQYDAIVEANGGRRGGFFDVMAWRGGAFLFVEYKGPGDRSNANESRWIEAALNAGIVESQLLFVTSTSSPPDQPSDT